MKIVSVVGTRPQYMKHWMLSKELRHRGHEVVLVHTGQHYDKNMYDVFFNELDMQRPDHNLDIGSGSHGMQTGKALMQLDGLLEGIQPDMVVVFGDCNSTLSGALSACKLNIPVCHVEAGLRCGDMSIPEEVNRVLVDHCSDILCCPTINACSNLLSEGLDGVFTGDLRIDSLQAILPKVKTCSNKDFILATVHRVSNTTPDRFREILVQLSQMGGHVLFPMHPRTRSVYDSFGFCYENIEVVDPVGYIEMIGLLQGCSSVVTDSGGLMVEGYYFGKSVVSLRSGTEYPELAVAEPVDGIFGFGDSRKCIVDCLEEKFK